MHVDMSAPLRRVSVSFPVPHAVQNLMCEPAEVVHFEFCDPVDVLMRLLLLSPLAADPKNLALVPEEGQYSDYCNGERMERVHAALPPGTRALTGVIFFDECNRDEKGFDTGDGGIIVAAFMRKRARESTHAKKSFATFPKVHFPPCNKQQVAVKHFTLALRQHRLRAIYKCFEDFNRTGGAVVRLQHGPVVYFPKAVLLAIYADQPAATKCTLSGSSCPVCFAKAPEMSPGHVGLHILPRTDDRVRKRKRALVNMSANMNRKSESEKRAKEIGVFPLDIECGLQCLVDRPDLWVFGPDPEQDNAYANMPQVNLHGMDEGLTLKLNYGCLMTALAEVPHVFKICHSFTKSIAMSIKTAKPI